MLFLAIRQLISRRRQSLLILLGITLGAAAYIVISGIMLGFQEYILDQLVNNEFQVRVSARDKSITTAEVNRYLFKGNEQERVFWSRPPSGRRTDRFIPSPQYWTSRFDSDPRVLAYSPQIIAQVLVGSGTLTEAGRLIGSDPLRQAKVSNIENHMLEGSFRDLASGGNRLIVGQGLAEKLGVRRYDVIELSLQTARGGLSTPFQIVGIFRTGIQTVDDTTLFGALSDVQRLNRTLGQVNNFAIKLKDYREAQNVSNEWRKLGEEKIESWAEANESILSVFSTQDIVRMFMTGSILVVAGFGVYNILSVTVTQKRREIAVLRAMGFVPRDIEFLFVFQGILLGILGGLSGIVIGYVVCVYLSGLEVTPGRISGPGDKFLVSFSPKIYWIGATLALGSAVASGYLPARAARKLSPIDLIRQAET